MSYIEPNKAMRLGLAAAHSRMQLETAVRSLADNLLAAEQGKGAGPSEADLEEVRRRYIVHQALDQAQRAEWAAARSEPEANTFASLALLAYRLTVFAAACIVLWQALR